MPDTIKVLFMAANPLGWRPLEFGREVRGIVNVIRMGLERDAFEFTTEWAVRPADLQHALLLHEPRIVHFSGHGYAEHGILLEDDTGAPRPVSGEALRELFTILKRSIRVVVLNACDSLPTIEAFHDLIDYTVGMSAPISDRAAIVFAEAFYAALACGTTVREAFALGVNRLRTEGIPETSTPTLLVRDGADATPLVQPAVRRQREDEWRALVSGAVRNFTVQSGAHNMVINQGEG